MSIYRKINGKMARVDGGFPLSTAFFASPDYDHVETINRISTENGTWTADRNGYALVNIPAGATAGIYALVNGAQAYKGTFVGGAAIKIARGDIVKITVSSGFSQCSCYFIPPKYTIDRAPVILDDPVKSYSFAEQDTGKTWVDGRKIYQKTVDCGAGPAAGVRKTVAHGIANVVYVLETKVMTNAGWSLPAAGGSGALRIAQGDRANVAVFSADDLTSVNLTATLFYTCTDR